MDTPEAFREAGGLDGSVVLIKDIDKNQFSVPGNTNASYDLRVGQRYRDHRQRAEKRLPKGGKIRLGPGMAVLIETEESVHLPRSAFGQIVPRVSLLQRGLSNTTSKVDPGYNGPLIITVFNMGRRTEYLHRGEPFCALFISNVLDGIRPYQQNPKRIEPEEETLPKLFRLRRWLARNSRLLKIVGIAIGILAGIVSVLSTLGLL